MKIWICVWPTIRFLFVFVGHTSVSDSIIVHNNRVGTKLFFEQKSITNLTSRVKAGSRHGNVGFPGFRSIVSGQTPGEAYHQRQHDGQKGGDCPKCTGDSERKFIIHDSEMGWVLWSQIFVHDFGTAIQHCASNDH